MKRIKVKEWEDFFEDYGLPKNLSDGYLEYVGKMARAKLPPIFEFRHLAAVLGRTQEYLASVINSPETHYREFKIPKRRGGFREISAPYPALLQCQRWINDNILSRCSVHESVHGFMRKRSIVTNASPHLDKGCILKVDIKDFFPSITINRVIKVFADLGYPMNVSFYLARLCCMGNVLCQGAATSPMLSNTIALHLDKRLSKIGAAWSLTYTRYSDDITFSGDRISIKFIEIVEEIVKDEGFILNKEKTKLCRSKGKRVVTGLSVSGTKLRLPHEYKHKLRQDIYFITRFGILSHSAKRKIRDPFYLDSIYGKLLYWKWIEPDNNFAERMTKKCSEIIDKFSPRE